MRRGLVRPEQLSSYPDDPLLAGGPCPLDTPDAEPASPGGGGKLLVPHTADTCPVPGTGHPVLRAGPSGTDGPALKELTV